MSERKPATVAEQMELVRLRAHVLWLTLLDASVGRLARWITRRLG